MGTNVDPKQYFAHLQPPEGSDFYASGVVVDTEKLREDLGEEASEAFAQLSHRGKTLSDVERQRLEATFRGKAGMTFEEFRQEGLGTQRVHKLGAERPAS
jgi:hypothetical protein